jgi:hypothetical protein
MKELLISVILLAMTACGQVNRFQIVRQDDDRMLKIDTVTGETWARFGGVSGPWEKIQTAP